VQSLLNTTLKTLEPPGSWGGTRALLGGEAAQTKIKQEGKTMTHEEIENRLNEVFASSPWNEDRNYPLEDWIYEVRNGDTRQGYRGWLYNRYANED